jgi:hypothetical protein
VALTEANVTSPAGDIDGAVWFPALSSGALTTLVEGYITDAASRAPTDEDAQKLWVYYRAATAVADRLTSSPASNTRQLDAQGSKTSTTIQAQIDYWTQKAAAYLAAFNEATDETADDDDGGWTVLTSLRHA